MALPSNFTRFNSTAGITAANLPQGFFFDLKEQLVAAGWTVEASGDGVAAYGAASDVILTGTKAANGVNDDAWFRVSNPDGRELCLQAVQGFTSDASSCGVRSKYSPAAGFVGGTPSATQVPSATDEGVFAGSGTDAAPTASSGGFIWGDRGQTSFAALRTFYLGLFETVSPYRFVFAMMQDAYAGCVGGIQMDVLDAPEIGAASHTDADRAVLYQAGRINSNAGAWGIRAADDLNRTPAAYAATGAGAMADVGGSFLPIACIPFGGNNEVFNQDSSDDFGDVAAGPGLWARYPDGIVGGVNGIKGMSSLFGFMAYPHDSIGWGTHRFFTVDGSVRELLMLNNSIIPWDGSDPYAGSGWTTAIANAGVKFWSLPDAFGGSAAITRVVGAPDGLPEDIAGGFTVG